MKLSSFGDVADLVRDRRGIALAMQDIDSGEDVRVDIGTGGFDVPAGSEMCATLRNLLMARVAEIDALLADNGVVVDRDLHSEEVVEEDAD